MAEPRHGRNVRFFDAHCDTIGPIWKGEADFAPADEPATSESAASEAVASDGGATTSGYGATATRGAAASRGAATSGADAAPHSAKHSLHVTLPGLKAGRIGVQVFASWVWTGAYKGQEYEVGMAKVEAVRRLCADYPDDLTLALVGADLGAPFAAGTADGDAADTDAADKMRTAILPSLEGADPLAGQVENLSTFHRAGVRLITLAWGDNAFCGSAYGDGTGLSRKGTDLVEACESLGMIVDVSHLSDKGLWDICDVARRPFVASHSNCRWLCPSPRNLTDEMIRAIGERGGAIGITLAPGFLSPEYYEREHTVMGHSFRTVLAGEASFEAAQTEGVAAMADVPRPPLSTVLGHVKRAIKMGGEDCVGLGGDLDGVDYLPADFEGAADYPRIEQLLRSGGLTSEQVEKVCYRNMLRVFQEILD